MKPLMEQLYDNLDEAKAFAISFTAFVYDYDDILLEDYCSPPCDCCGRMIQNTDYLAPKSNCKKPCGILTTFNFGVSPTLRDDLIANFDITEEDFRPIRSKKGEIVYYQITPQHTMLPLEHENKWHANKPCSQCGSYFYKNHAQENKKGEDFYYISQRAIDDMHDINVTFEKFSKFYIPHFVISRRVYDYLVERYPKTHFFPFFLKKN